MSRHRPCGPDRPGRQRPDETEIIITATKREENLQNVPISVQAIGTRRLDQLNISNFEDYTKQLPSVSFDTSQPGSTTVYVRGVATGSDGNHTGSLPSVGFYLDEQPVTTIGGTLDVHIYDIARIESLAGPQGTLYGASSEAGTIRIITNKPEIGVTAGRIDGELNRVSHGGTGGSLEGMINLPVSDRIAFRASGFYQRDAGYIDNVFGERTYCGDPIKIPDPKKPGKFKTIGCEKNGFHVDNSAFVKKNFNTQKIYGGRAALKIDLDDNWTVTPTVMYQNSHAEGAFFEDYPLGDLEVQRFRKEPTRDKFTQYALTVEGKIGNFDITYAGAYMHRPTYGVSDYTEYADAYDAYYESSGGIANYLYFLDDAGESRRSAPVHHRHQQLQKDQPRTAHRFSRGQAAKVYRRRFLPASRERHFPGLSGRQSRRRLFRERDPGTLWLTKEKRIDRDRALFGEVSFDIMPQITLTGGGRYYKFNNTVFGFAGFGRNPLFIQDENGDPIDPDSCRMPFTVRRPALPNASPQAAIRCANRRSNGTDTVLIGDPLSGTPCVNVGRFEDGEVKAKQSKGDGFTYKFNGTYKPRDGLMFYATWSKGFRPGGINRQPGLAPYKPDFLINYELGWKTSFGPLRWNGAIYHQKWDKFQFSFLGENSLTVVQNGRGALIDGVETDVNYVAGGLTLNAAAAYTNARVHGNACDVASDTTPDCDMILVEDDPTTAENEEERDIITAPSGRRLPVTPKFKITATARYSWGMGPGKAHAQASIVHQGSAPSYLKTEDAVLGKIPALDDRRPVRRL